MDPKIALQRKLWKDFFASALGLDTGGVAV